MVDAYFYELSEHSTTKSRIVFPSSSCHSTILWGSKRDAAFAIVSLPSQFWIKTSGKQQDNDSHENIAPLMSVYAWPRILRASHDPASFERRMTPHTSILADALPRYGYWLGQGFLVASLWQKGCIHLMVVQCWGIQPTPWSDWISRNVLECFL